MWLVDGICARLGLDSKPKRYTHSTDCCEANLASKYCCVATDVDNHTVLILGPEDLRSPSMSALSLLISKSYRSVASIRPPLALAATFVRVGKTLADSGTDQT